MACLVKRGLTALEVKSAAPGYHGDGGGLWLQVTKALSRTWVYRFTIRGKSREMGLGSTSTVSLADARAAALGARKLVLDHIDPIEERRARIGAQAAAVARVMTFDQCAAAYVAAQEAGWRNAKHAAQWSSTLTTYAGPVFGALPVNQVDQTLILKALEPIWTAKTETASRLRGRIEKVLDYATSRGLREGVNPAQWKGHLALHLPQPGKVMKVTHHAALPFLEINSFVTALRQLDGFGARCLEFTILTASRTGEAIGAEWSEFDLEAKLWTVPASRMKAGREHRVALSPQAVTLLKSLPKIDAARFVFPTVGKDKPLSTAAMTAVLRRMKRDDITTHGFRSTFRDWAAEATSFPSELVEMCLAHAINNKVEAAYRRGDMFQRRLTLMNNFAEYVDRKHKVGNVVQIRTA